MANIVGAVATSHIPAIGRAIERNLNGDHLLRVEQGVEMGRPSVLMAEADTRDGRVVAARIGGDSVMVGDGYLEVN